MQEDFPQLCETCLGLNPYVRMIKTAFGSKLCKVSSAPYQGFRWKAGPHGRFKETTICFDVARHKNICQSCLNDMQYGLPVGVRDSILVGSLSAVKPPDSAVGKAVFYSQQSRPGDGHAEGSSLFSNDIKNAAPSRQLDHFSNAMYAAQSNNREKTAFRNLPKLCSFWLNGTCSRVVRSVCPFRPCCGVYVFPELASTHRDLMDLLIDNLNKFGAVEVQKTLDPLLRSTFRDAMKGNRDESIRKRVNGEDDLTQKYLKKMRAGVRFLC